MNICLVTPAPPGSRRGNRITAQRWARILRSLGHRVRVVERFDGGPGDMLVALHARRSHGSIKAFARAHPGRPIILALTGTDLYRDIRTSRAARESLELADRLVVLQAEALRELSAKHRRKARVIHQSVELPSPPPPRGIPSPRPPPWKGGGGSARHFDVCVMGHLRAVKDPLRAALAARRLPAESRIRIVHLGAALTAAMERRARAEERRNPRYRWLGDLPRAAALRRLARCRLLVLSSRMEGGANAIGEAVVAGVPVIASRIAGSIGLLGRDYPGYFPVGDTEALARLLRRADMDRGFYDRLSRRCAALRPLFDPQRERRSWAALLDELAGARILSRTRVRGNPFPRLSIDEQSSRSRAKTASLRARL